MYKIAEGVYGKLVVKNTRKVFEIYIITQLGTLLVYGKVLKIYKYEILFWKHFGPWIKQYKKLVKEKKRELLSKKKECREAKRLNKQEESKIKKSYDK